MVTPGQQKLGGDVATNVAQIAPDGNSVLYIATNAFGDATNGMGATGNNLGYLASRGDSGWSSQFMTGLPQPVTSVQSTFLPVVYGASLDLSKTFLDVQYAAGPDFTSGVWDSDRTGATNLVAGQPAGAVRRPSTVGSSSDGSHQVIAAGDSTPLEPIPGSPTLTGPMLYDYANGALNRVNVDDNGDVLNASGATFASMIGTAATTSRNAVSADGTRIFFYSQEPGAAPADPPQLFVRVDGQTTIEISASSLVGPQAVTFAGASADGTKAFFTSSGQLTADATGSGPFLYEFDLPRGASSGQLRLIGGVDHPVTATLVTPSFTWLVPNVLVSDDGSHVYYGTTDGGLYVYETGTGETRQVASAVGDALLATVVGQTRLANAGDVSADGRYLVFLSADRPLGADTPGGQQMYRYADDESPALVRVSQSPSEPADSFDTRFVADNGSTLLMAKFMPVRGNYISNDGRYVFFETSAALVPSDVNGVNDVYRWHDGDVSIVSGGVDPNPSYLQGASADGSSVFFVTLNELVPQDGDDFYDIYDARVGGGFPYTYPTPECAGEACQGPASTPPSIVTPGSSTFDGIGNVDEPDTTTPAFTVKALSPAAKRKLAKSGKVTVTVRTNGPGTVVAGMAARAGRSWVSTSDTKRAVKKAGQVSLRLTLARSARRYLATHRKGMRVRVAVSFSHVPGREESVFTIKRVGVRHRQPAKSKKTGHKR
jgi:hypothetical protein